MTGPALDRSSTFEIRNGDLHGIAAHRTADADDHRRVV